jgi:tubulin polyglutamylase TTLL6/13
MHLTNYAINKASSAYEQGDPDQETGHKRSLGAILKILQDQGCDTQQLMDKIKDMIVKTMIVAQPILAHEYRTA